MPGIPPLVVWNAPEGWRIIAVSLTDVPSGERMDTIRSVQYYVTQVSNKAGEAVRVLSALRGVGLLAFTGFPSGKKAQLDFVPEDALAFTMAAKQAKVKVKVKKGGFLVQGDDR